MSEAAIQVKDISYQYNDLLAVDRITFDVPRGEILGFLGPNGAGKSTTVKMLTGQLRPKSGSVSLLGMDVAKNTQAIQARIGVCFETTNLYESMTGLENLRLFARLFGVKNFDGIALLERIGLASRGKDRVDTYSKGMKQRLMVARSLVNTPDILFLDEPTEGLDPTSSQTIREIILAERDRGATVFLTTHDMLEADKLADKVAFINKGQIVALDTPHTLKQQYGQRALKIEMEDADGKLVTKEVVLDAANTADAMHAILSNEKVITVHSEEATLEDIFMQITGRGLV